MAQHCFDICLTKRFQVNNYFQERVQSTCIAGNSGSKSKKKKYFDFDAKVNNYFQEGVQSTCIAANSGSKSRMLILRLDIMVARLCQRQKEEGRGGGGGKNPKRRIEQGRGKAVVVGSRFSVAWSEIRKVAKRRSTEWSRSRRRGS